MATKGTPAAKKPAPVAAAVETAPEEGAVIEIGSQVKFLGYNADTPADERYLTDGEVYEVIGFTEVPADAPEGTEGNPVVALPNVDFNPKKKEHAETNPKTFDVEVLIEEIELAEEEAQEEVVEEVAAAPVKPAAKTAKAAPAKAAPAKAAPAKAEKGKTKVAAAAKKVKEPKVEEVPEDPTPDLENEDPDVLALIEGAEDLVALAQETEADSASKEWQFGGVLYHIKKDKSYENLEGGEEYKLPGGFEKFVQEFFNMEYRKAMWLIEIYKNFTIAQIENPAAAVAKMGWTKAKTIAKLLVEPDNEAHKGDLVELALTNTVADLSTAITETYKVGGTKGTPGEVKKRVTLKFRFLEATGSNVNAILEAAKDQLGVKDIGEALVQIVSEWASEHGGAAATKAAAPKATAAAKPAAKAVAAPAKAAAPVAKAAAPAAKRVAAKA